MVSIREGFVEEFYFWLLIVFCFALTKRSIGIPYPIPEYNMYITYKKIIFISLKLYIYVRLLES